MGNTEVRLNEVGRNTQIGKKGLGDADMGGQQGKRHLSNVENSLPGWTGLGGTQNQVMGAAASGSMMHIAKHLADMSIRQTMAEKHGAQGDLEVGDTTKAVANQSLGTGQMIQKQITA